MSVSRRSFLIGAGSIISAAFVKDAWAHACDTGTPMVARHIAWRVDAPFGSKTIFYERFEDHWRLHLGEPQFEIPEPPLLITNLRQRGYFLNTQQQIDALCDDTGWTEKELFAPMDASAWEDQWAHNFSPEAQAFEFLQKHNVFPLDSRWQRAGQVIFESYPNPMCNARWVEVHDQFSLTLLQARLDELSLGPSVREYSKLS